MGFVHRLATLERFPVTWIPGSRQARVLGLREEACHASASIVSFWHGLCLNILLCMRRDGTVSTGGILGGSVVGSSVF
jgi:hypothetical protein